MFVCVRVLWMMIISFMFLLAWCVSHCECKAHLWCRNMHTNAHTWGGFLIMLFFFARAIFLYNGKLLLSSSCEDTAHKCEDESLYAYTETKSLNISVKWNLIHNREIPLSLFKRTTYAEERRYVNHSYSSHMIDLSYLHPFTL